MDKTDASSRLLKPNFSSENKLQPYGFSLSIDRSKLAARSAKISALLEENPRVELSCFLKNIPVDSENIELVLKFCNGLEPRFSSENVIQLICLAKFLEMSENHSTNNLLKRVLDFLEQRVLPSWDETIKALRLSGNFLPEAARLGLLEPCLDSLAEKAQMNPHLLGDPFKISSNGDDTDGIEEEEEVEEEYYRPNARRRLFRVEWESEDLTKLPLQLYQPIIFTMNQNHIPPRYVAASLCRYAELWVFSCSEEGDNMLVYDRHSQRDVIETVESLLPNEKGLVPCTLLFKLLKFATSLDCSHECRNGFEYRIGQQLEQATVNDLLMKNPCQGVGNADGMEYDVESLRRILKHFYGNYSSGSGIIAVAVLIEEFLMEIASDRDLKIDTFRELGDISMAVSVGIQKNCDGIYRAIDIYLDKNRNLTETEKEEICRTLDCQKMSPEACEHAVTNERLPLRFVVQVLFICQSQIRNTFANQVRVFDETLRKVDEEEEQDVKGADSDAEELRNEMNKMSIKVMELEQECCVMKKEIVQNGSKNHQNTGKFSMWKQMKRKLGCMSSVHDSNSQVKRKKLKKIHPKY
ncbi:BTB/POZ domain-containing protein At5g17580 [Mercurialis annua]|uniref:BTB/POZ domain-containing protein At5g17580 n=1 Tax=Mercurialis annua TaxID=3986 RepID=UPI00216105CE|nr:BTB/POZ domain-containing protein At5g17580 [Mercurialis annua]